MGLVLWLGYSIYFYDEEDGRDYVGDFIDSLARQDGRVAAEIMNLLFRRLSNGEGIPVEWTKGSRPKVKTLSNRDIFEYRGRSSKLRKEIRVYFGCTDHQRQSSLWKQASRQVTLNRRDILRLLRADSEHILRDVDKSASTKGSEQCGDIR